MSEDLSSRDDPDDIDMAARHNRCEHVLSLPITRISTS
jgi:hypothetical protein